MRPSSRRPHPSHSIQSPSVTVVIPALNEENNLPLVLENLPPVDEVVVVDGRSDDDTVAVAREVRPDVIVVRQTRAGKGNALACGFAAATGDIVVTLNADGSADPGEIPRFVDALVTGAEAAHGSRFREGGEHIGARLTEEWGHALLSRAVNLLYRTRFTDLSCSFNAYWRELLPVLDLPAPVVPGLKRGRLAWGDGQEIETLITIRMATRGLRVVEVASVGYPRLSGIRPKPLLPAALRILRTITTEYARRWSREPHRRAHRPLELPESQILRPGDHSFGSRRGALPGARPYSAPPVQPYSAPPVQPYSAPPVQPYSAPPVQPYSAPPTEPSFMPSARPYSAPPIEPTSAPATESYAAARVRPTSSAADRPYSAPPLGPASSAPDRGSSGKGRRRRSGASERSVAAPSHRRGERGARRQVEEEDGRRNDFPTRPEEFPTWEPVGKHAGERRAESYPEEPFPEAGYEQDAFAGRTGYGSDADGYRDGYPAGRAAQGEDGYVDGASGILGSGAYGYRKSAYGGGGHKDRGYQAGAYQDTGYQDSHYQADGYQDSHYQADGYQDSEYRVGGHQADGHQHTGYTDARYTDTGYTDSSYEEQHGGARHAAAGPPTQPVDFPTYEAVGEARRGRRHRRPDLRIIQGGGQIGDGPGEYGAVPGESFG